MAGLRERKKEQTKQRITAVASQLFAERGFEAVTVSESADAAQVAKATLFHILPQQGVARAAGRGTGEPGRDRHPGGRQDTPRSRHCRPTMRRSRTGRWQRWTGAKYSPRRAWSSTAPRSAEPRTPCSTSNAGRSPTYW
ncbi:TetR/AcrR family transcriptional regulator [Streptomyces sp. NPDC057543]|uniref:TetR/AcrR family transcriptional regulator n=1 Tax=Streptomyces sp. NPDC057543 TaxID=3346163 RepID=UPI0036AF9801